MKDIIDAKVLNLKRCVEAIEETFELLGKGDYIMGGVSEQPRLWSNTWEVGSMYMEKSYMGQILRKPRGDCRDQYY